MIQKNIDEAIFEKYIAPTKAERSRCIGIEIEMPVVNLNKAPVEEDVIFELSKAFRKRFGFKAVGYDADGNVNSMIDDVTGDDLSYDCSYSNLELSLGKGENLFEIKKRFDEYYIFINEFFAKYNYTLTGMGINPYYNINHNNPIPNERYRMLYHYLNSYVKYKDTEFLFHNRPDFAMFCSASQVQIDVRYDDLIDVINTFGKIEPYKALIFSNSYFPESPKLMCSRNMLWEHSMQGYNPHNLGMFDCTLSSIDDLINYIKTNSIYCTMRNGKYIDFTPIPIDEFWKLDSVRGEYFDGEKYREIEFTPSIEDFQYLRTFKFEDLTFRGTIEFRSSCCQPIRDSMTVAAFHIGLMENVPALKQLIDNDTVIYSHGYNATELQRIFSKIELPHFADKDKVSKMLISILDIAEEGLKLRGHGEEFFLKPLYERAERLTNPAKEMLCGLERGETLEHFIAEYAKI